MNKFDKVIFVGVIMTGFVIAILLLIRFIYNVIVAEDFVDRDDVV